MGIGGVAVVEDDPDGVVAGFLVGEGVVIAVGQLDGRLVDGQLFVGSDDGAGGGDVVAVVGDQLLGEAVDRMGDPGRDLLVGDVLEVLVEVGVDGEGVVFGQGAEE